MKAKKKAPEVAVEEAAEEVVVEKVPCVDCTGTGLKDSKTLCPSCEGHG